MNKRCACCLDELPSIPSVRNHSYCSKRECQKERKRLWQKRKSSEDNSYRESKADAQRKWSSAKTGYWKEYRANHPDYVKRNREKQQERNRKRPRKRASPESGVIAKMDTLTPQNIIPFGRYRLVPLATGVIAKTDALIVEIGIVSSG
jgi:hypothetical protein